jgi:hypothetical protein
MQTLKRKNIDKEIMQAFRDYLFFNNLKERLLVKEKDSQGLIF